MADEWKLTADAMNAADAEPAQVGDDAHDRPIQPADGIEPITASAAAPVPTSPSLRARLRRLFANRDEAETARRSQTLDRAIEKWPDAPVNYVIRGELHLRAGAYQQAHDDFWIALELAGLLVQQQDWGLVAQVIQDRALVGLEQARRHIEPGV